MALGSGGLDLIGLRAVLETQDFERGMRVYQNGITEMETQTEKSSKKAAKATEDMARKQEQALQRVGLAFSAAGAAGLALLGAIAMTASRTEELGIILDVTATNAQRMAEANGDYARAASLSADAVHGQVQAVKELGITTQVASQLVAQMIRYNLDWQKATDLARLSQDAATFAAQDSSQALQGLIHGITTLNVRVLRTYGILVSLEQEYQKFAEANNRTTSSLSATEKQAIALNAVLAQAPNIAGAYEAAMDTASKQMRSLSRYTTEVAEAFGKHLTPALNAGVMGLRDVLKWLRDLEDPIQATAVQIGVMTSGLFAFIGGAALLIPKVISLAKAIKNLALVQNLASAGMLGPAGLVAGLTAAAVAYGLYARNVEKSRRAEAGGIADTAESYKQYLTLLDDAELGSYALSESLWEIAKSANAAADGLDAMALTEAFRELAMGLGGAPTGVEEIDALIKAMNQAGYNADWWQEQWSRMAESLSKAEIAILSDAEAVRQLGEEIGLSGADLVAFVDDTLNSITVLKAQQDAADGLGHSMIGLGAAIGDVTKKARDAKVHLAAVNVVMEDLEGATKATAKELANFYKVLAQYDEQSSDAVEDAAGRMVDAEDKAADSRKKARKDLLDAQKDLEEDHADTVSGLMDDLAEVDKDLKADLLQAEEQYQQERAGLADEYHDDILDAERELAQDIEDAQRDLNRDLEDLERDHSETLEGLRRDHYADMAALQVEYGEKQAAIAEKYAKERAAIEQKYHIGPEPKTFDEQREELLAQLEKYQNKMGISYAQERMEIEAELEKLKEAELAALEERKGEELDELQKALEAEQAEREGAYQTALEAEQNAYQKRQEEKQRQYDRDLEDLHRSIAQEKQEIERRYQERLGALDRQLQEERQRLDEAAQEARIRLQEQLAGERQNYAERRQELQSHYREQIQEINDSLAEEKAKIREGLAEELRDIIEGLGDQSQAFRDAYAQQLLDLEGYLGDRLERERQYQRELEDLYGIDSPSKWMVGFAKDLTAGLDIGLGPSFATGLGDALTAFQSNLGTLGPSPIQPAAMPYPVAQPSVSTSESFNIDFQAHYAREQSEASARDDLNLTMMQLRSMNRGRR